MTDETLEVRETRVDLLRQYPIDGLAVKRLAQAGMNWLEANKQTVNALNVFPVPDGDTGTNMLLTMKSAIEEIETSGERQAGKMLDSIAKGALMGARGNSGVILSQLWRGFAKAVEGKQIIDTKTAVAGFASARDTAYKGVVRPVEGTILTVAKDVAEATAKVTNGRTDTIHIIQIARDAAAESVERTPDLLPILKEAGVVDSGGKGLFYILEGMLRWIYGQQIHTAESVTQPLAALNFEQTMESVEEGQDYEVVVDFRPSQPLDLPTFYQDLEAMGTSIQVGEGDGMYRMHIHVPTEKRYEPIDYTMGLGTVTNVAIENLIAQMDRTGKHAGDLNLATVGPEHIAVVAVAPGRGIARHFAELGAAAIVEGGQTMNPSTKDILSAFENLPAEKVIILPNNENILMAAEAAAEITVKQVAVIPTTSAPQGLSAMLRLAPDGEFDTVVEQMKAAIQEVETGEVTTATRDVDIDGVEVKEGQIIGLHNGKLIASAEELEKACLDLLQGMKAKDYELVTIFYGEDVNPEQAARLAETVSGTFPDLEIEIQEGGQPHYQFIFSLE
jgi:DAK2 domain fusion protein YloV